MDAPVSPEGRAPPHMVVTHNAFTAFIRIMPPRSHRISLSLRKLSKFSDTHLMELSTDIYDELRRRQNPNSLPGENLPIKAGIHPQRNDARRKLGSLSYERFGDMCKDIVAEQERRYPQLAIEGGALINEFIDEPEVKDGFAPGMPVSTPRLETFGSPYPGNDLVASPVVNRGSLQFSVDSERSNHSPASPVPGSTNQHLLPGAMNPQDDHTHAQQIVQTSVSHVKTQMMMSESGSDSDDELNFEDRTETNQKRDVGADQSTKSYLESGSYATPKEMCPSSTLSALSPVGTTNSRENDMNEEGEGFEDLAIPGVPDRYDSRSPHGASSVDYEDIDDEDLLSTSTHQPNNGEKTVKPKVSFTFDDDDAKSETTPEERYSKSWSTVETDLANHDDESEDDLNEEPNMATKAYEYQEDSNKASAQEYQQPDIANEVQDSESDVNKSLETRQEVSLAPSSSAVSDEVTLLKSRLEEIEQRLAAAEMRATEAEAETAQAVERAETAESNDATSKSELASVLNEKITLSEKVLTLESRISELEQTSRVEQQKCAAAELHASQVEHALSEAKSRVDATEEELQALKVSHSKELQQNRNSSTGNVADASSDIRLITKQRNNLEEEHAALKEQLEALHIIVREQHEDLTRAPTVHRNADDTTPMARSVEQPETLEAGDVQLVKDFSDLQLRHENLKEELASQQAITERVRQEAAMFLEEMRDLAQRQANEAKEKVSDGARIDELTAHVKKLTIEAQEWRMKYVDSLSELKKLRDIHRSSMLPSALRFLGGPEIHKSSGLLSSSLVVELQSALDDFLLNAREDKRRGEILSDLHRVILATRGIVAEAKAHDPKYTDAVKLVSRTANQMISVVRNFSVSSGLLPLTLVDAACSDLAVSVIELVKVAGIHDATASPHRSSSPVRHSMHFEDSPLKNSHATPDEQMPSPSQQRRQFDQKVEPQSTLFVPHTRPSSNRESMSTAPRYTSGSSAPFSAVPAIPPPQVPEGERRQARESMIRPSGPRVVSTPPGPPNAHFSRESHENSVSPAPSMADTMSFDQIVMGASSPAGESSTGAERVHDINSNSRQMSVHESNGGNTSPIRNQNLLDTETEQVRFGESLSPLKPTTTNTRSPSRKPVPSQEFNSKTVSHMLNHPDEYGQNYESSSKHRSFSQRDSVEQRYDSASSYESSPGYRNSRVESMYSDAPAVNYSLDRSAVKYNIDQAPDLRNRDSHDFPQKPHVATETLAPSSHNEDGDNESNFVSVPEPESEPVPKQNDEQAGEQKMQGALQQPQVEMPSSSNTAEFPVPQGSSTPDSLNSVQHSRELDVSPLPAKAKATRELASPELRSPVEASLTSVSRVDETPSRASQAAASKVDETPSWASPPSASRVEEAPSRASQLAASRVEEIPSWASHAAASRVDEAPSWTPSAAAPSRASQPENNVYDQSTETTYRQVERSPTSDVIRAPERRQPTAPSPAREVEIDASVARLQQYLEEQTSETIEATSSLLSGIKENATSGHLKPLINKIIEFVNEMINATGSTMSSSTNTLLRTKGRFIVENLRDCSQRMDAIYDEIHRQRDDSKLNRATKQRLAGCAFDMAKCTKELVKTVEEVTLVSELEQIDMALA